ncbi:MAG TPA: threonine/serine exporter family protein [Candidatus Ruminococcus avistercoris]|nr:threonine/serine exporter family protein [Candidatus Ruminococcus avistercoris]
MDSYNRRVLDLAMGAGKILLQSGAEIFRVEETIRRISRHYGVENSNAFVLSNGIFLTGQDQMGEMYAYVKHIPISGTQLNKVDAVNRLSREIEQGLDLELAEKKLRHIKTMPGKKPLTLVNASAVGAGAFCYIIGGMAGDCLAAVLAGGIVGLYQILMGRRKKATSKLALNLVGAFLATALSLLFYRLRIGLDYRAITVGAIMPMLPGVSFVTSIRELANGDYIAGTIRLLDTLLVTAGIAMGVGLFYILYYEITGGYML